MSANQRQAITVWKDGGWKQWSATDAHYAENDPNWLVTIPLEGVTTLAMEPDNAKPL